MAYVASDVYENGIASEVFGDNIYIALAAGDRGPTETDPEFLRKILAVSEIRKGRGVVNVTDEQEEEPSDVYNNVGEFRSKVLSLLSVAYNRTKSVEGDTTNFSYCDVNAPGDSEKIRNARHFAIIKFDGPVVPLTAYQVDNGDEGTTDIKFNGPTITTDNQGQHKVLIVGNLTSNPTINKDSNFMFGGAKITFTEA
jgi:hypothetical protein